MGIGDKISLWLRKTEPFETIIEYTDGVGTRNNKFISKLNAIPNFYDTAALAKIVLSGFVYITYVIFGVGSVDDYTFFWNNFQVDDNVSEDIGEFLRTAANSELITEIMQSMGALAYDPFKGMMTQYGGKDTIDIDEFVRNFYGYLMMLPLLGNLTNALGQTATFGIVDSIGKPIEESYFTLGLGFMGWQGISPLLSESMLPIVTREAKRTYRQTRFKTGDVLDLYAQNKISLDQTTTFLRDEGWRDSDIPTVIELSRKGLTKSEYDKLLKLGEIEEGEYRTFLRQLGYSDSAINWLVILENKEEQSDPRGISYSLAKKAYKLHSISANEFRVLLLELGYTNEAIDLELVVLDFEEETELKELSVGQLSQAFLNNVINETEAKTALLEIGYTNETSTILIETWLARKQPKVIRLNQGSITRAVSVGVITPNQGFTRLVEIGYDANDAQIIIDSIAVEQNSTVKVPSEGKIMLALQRDIITQQDARQRLKANGYSTDDANFLIELATTTDKIRIEYFDVEQAYLYSVLTRQQAEQQLASLNASSNYISTKLDTLDQQKKRLKIRFNANQIGKWYRQELISENEAVLKLIDIGYTPDDSRLFLRSVSIAEPEPLSDNAIEEALVNGIITRDKAFALFKELGLSDENIIIRLDTIALENGTPQRQASIATLITAVRDGIITDNDLQERLELLGFNASDINLYLAIANKRNTNVETKLTKADILKGFKIEHIRDIEALALLESKGFTLEESGFLLALAGRDVRNDEIFLKILDGTITVEDGVNQLLAKGYTYEEIIDGLLNPDIEDEA